MKLKALFASLLLLIFMSSAVLGQTSPRIEVLAHHCAWYQIPWDLIPYTMPLKGLYNSNDPIVAALQNEEKIQYGIGVDVVSWPGPLHTQENALLSGLCQTYNFSARKFCFLYEIIPLLGDGPIYDFSDPVLREKFLFHVDYISQFSSAFPNYYRINNRPVVYIWTGEFRNFQEVSALARQKIYLVGPLPILFPPSPSAQEYIRNFKCFDALTSYGIDPVYLAQKYNGELSWEAIQEFAIATLKWDTILKVFAPQTDLFISLQFAYHDNRGDVDAKTGKTRILTSTKEQAELMAKTVQSLTLATGRTKVFIVSYNEHFEGTSVEPSFEQGDWWLQLIKKYLVIEPKIDDPDSPSGPHKP
jgi:hypothetical protein